MIKSLKFKLLFCLTMVFSGGIAQQNMNVKVVIAHRGASGYLPEHTMESKAMAYAMNVDYIEQDLVLSKDNVPIVNHDIYLDEVSDVAAVYPGRSRDDGRFYVIDFTLEELLVLNLSERIDLSTNLPVYPNRFPFGKSQFKLHTLQEEIELIQGLNKSTGKHIGIYPEIKNPGFHLKQGKDISKIVLNVLKQCGYTNKSDACILQCFDAVELKRIRNELKSDLFLTQLMGSLDGIDDLDNYALFADAIGPSISQLVMDSYQKNDKTYNDLVAKAHQLNLKVHAYTFRIEELEKFSSFNDLLDFSFKQLNIDGGFTDFPDIVLRFLNN